MREEKTIGIKEERGAMRREGVEMRKQRENAQKRREGTAKKRKIVGRRKEWMRGERVINQRERKSVQMRERRVLN